MTERSTEFHNVLDAFAPEHDLIVPPRHAAQTPLAPDFQFVFDRAPFPLPPVRDSRGRSWLVFTVLVLLGTATLGAYLYYPGHPLDLDTIAAWASHVTRPRATRMTVPATAPSETRPNDPAPTDPPVASKASAVSPKPDRPADTGSTASNASVSEIARPTAVKPESTGTSRSLASPVQNVSGEWRLTAQVETSDSSLADLELHYEMKLKQDGDRVTGVGTKVSENAQTPVTMTGAIAGGRLTLNVLERGTPETQGKFVLLLDKAGILQGRSSTSASSSSGHVEGHRVSPAR